MSEQYTEDVLKSVKYNHIWLNAFSCINPTEEFKLQLANDILDWLNKDGRTILCDYSEPLRSTLKQKELVIRINKS